MDPRIRNPIYRVLSNSETAAKLVDGTLKLNVFPQLRHQWLKWVFYEFETGVTIFHGLVACCFSSMNQHKTLCVFWTERDGGGNADVERLCASASKLRRHRRHRRHLRYNCEWFSQHLNISKDFTWANRVLRWQMTSANHYSFHYSH